MYWSFKNIKLKGPDHRVPGLGHIGRFLGLMKIIIPSATSCISLSLKCPCLIQMGAVPSKIDGKSIMTKIKEKIIYICQPFHR